MKKRILSALLLACALVIAPVGNIFSTMATASSNIGPRANSAYARINPMLPDVFGHEYVNPWTGEVMKFEPSRTAAEVMQKVAQWYTAEELQELRAFDPNLDAVFVQLGYAAEAAGTTAEASSAVQEIPSVSVSGAELNAGTDGATVALTVAAPAETADLGGINGVQVDINLSGVADSHNLLSPVKITLSVPTGLAADNMHIRHYVNGAGAAYAVVPFTANGDGTITFSVSSFSLFAFVEGPAPEAPVTPDVNGDDNNNDDGNDNNEEPAAAEPQGVKDSVPKTGDSTVPVLPFAVTGAACVAAAVVLKKREQA